jgi:hypothetical protein
MALRTTSTALIFIATLLCTSGSFAGSSTASLAAEGASSAAGSASNSLGASSNSSKGNNVASGDYKIIEVAAAPNKPGKVQLTLQAIAKDSPTPQVVLTLPELTFEKTGLTKGDIIAASEQTYGVKFAQANNQKAFYLVINDDIYRELASNPIAL